MEDQPEAKTRVSKNTELGAIAEAIKVLKEKGIHPFILENLQNQHYKQIAARFANYEIEREDDDLDIEDENEEGGASDVSEY